MKSSGPVFKRQNPFQPSSRMGKTDYHPPLNRSMSKKEKKTTLSPVRSNQLSSSKLHSRSPESQRLFEKSDSRFNTADGQPVFSESWPSTECDFSPASTASSPDTEMPDQSARAVKSTVSSQPEVHQDSVLAKYIERFRHGRPKSREERQQSDSKSGEKLPFWWMSNSSLPPSSTPMKTTDNDFIQPLKSDHGAILNVAEESRRDKSLSPCRGSLTILSDTSQGEFDDTEILHLQERANRLLLREYDDYEYTQNDGSIHVSSEGLGCSDFSSPVSVDEPLRRPLLPILKSPPVMASSDSIQAVSSQKSSGIPSLVCPSRPEEDILFQWRLRRKIELAREHQSLQHRSLQGATFSWQAPSLNHPSASGQAYKSPQLPELSQNATHPHVAAPQTRTKEGHTSCPPAPGPPPSPTFVLSGSSVSQTQSVAHVPPHMHLLCDVLPCPIQSSCTSRRQNISQSIDETTDNRVVCNKIKDPRNSIITSTDEAICEHMPSPVPALSGVIEGEGPDHHKRSQRNKKEKTQTKESERTALSSRRQKKSRYAVYRECDDVQGSANKSSSHQTVPKKVRPCTEQQQQKGSQEFSSGSCIGDYAPPPSPIHCALGQVVSEVLFPTSAAERTSGSSVSPPCTASAPPQSSALPCDAQSSMEVISQLLQEAEGSDEKEFEDDPLLQVLRKQRSWVKKQISEVDSVLNELLDEQRVT